MPAAKPSSDDPPENSGCMALNELIDTLRGENGCPWDREQTPQSIALYLVEEVFELVDAIASGHAMDICEELGDVLFHVFFIARMFEEKGDFDMETVNRTIARKMIRRHPHVFGDSKINGTKEVRAQWREIKRREKENRHPGPVLDSVPDSVLDSVPGGLPALMRAYRISERAAGSGFDWHDISGVMDKVEEEWAELKNELSREARSGEKIDPRALEFGDVLFTLVNVARFAGFHPETALAESTAKFEKRFRLMEKMIAQKGKSLQSLPADEQQRYWDIAKRSYPS